MGNRLTSEEVENRLQRLRNFEKRDEVQRSQIQTLRELTTELREQVSTLTDINRVQLEMITTLTLQNTELKEIVFGSKKKRKKKGDDDMNDSTPSLNQGSPRTKDSYKRPLPNENEITERKHHQISSCSCGQKLTRKEIVIYYEEDIPLPIKKTVTCHSVEKGYCPCCHKWQTAAPLPTAKVIIGRKVRKLVTVLSVVNLNSYSQIESLLANVFSFSVSQGEIAGILAKEANHLNPAYERLKEKIRGAPVKGIDETGWKVFQGNIKGDYAWVLNSVPDNESLFLLGQSRGKGNVSTLLGEVPTGYTVSDDYGAYNSLKKDGKHQLCFAHPHRKLRDLAHSDDLKGKSLKACQKAYQKFVTVYADLKEKRDPKRYTEFKKRLVGLSKVGKNDPIKLIQIKEGIRKNIPSYLTCLSDPRIPLDNNQTERSLRHLVLKRKMSFGSLNQRTAGNLSILLSVILTLKQQSPHNFFEKYLRV